MGKDKNTDIIREGIDGASKDMQRLNDMLNEKDAPSRLLWLGQDAFGNIYRYLMRYINRYNTEAYKLLFTVRSKDENASEEEISEAAANLGEIIKTHLRNSDLMMQTKPDQFFLLLPELSSKDLDMVIKRVFKLWEESIHSDRFILVYEIELIQHEKGNDQSADKENAWVIVVDDDVSILKSAGKILSDEGIRVTALKSGESLLDYVSEKGAPDLVLLDIMMPGLDGFDTLKKLKKLRYGKPEIPVIFLTGNDDEGAEERGLTLGALDFIKKPFTPAVLTLRVKHMLELLNLQANLSSEVDKKTEEVEHLSIHIVQSLANAIDAKDKYTKGHSGRVADYAREIARRVGYGEKEINDVYMMGLLHDVGKIGIPDDVINKPAKLTEEEYNVIKQHPVMAAMILENIREMPQLTVGAKWHHERYDGKGYPDGLKGDDIPEEARIIAVADAYDAMSSRRSYREALSQDHVREQIIKGTGTQFDPKFAKIMLDMMDEDPEYKMRE